MNMRGKRKIGRKILAFVLSVCMLFTVQPNLWDGVMVQAAEKVENDTDDIIQALLDRIAVLPDAEEYLAAEPDMEKDEDAYTEWEEKLYEYAEEALVIWEEYEVLAGEQQAKIPEEGLAKLEVWMEIADTLEESCQVMAVDGSTHTHCFCGGNIKAGDHTETEHTDKFVYDKILTSNDSGQLLIDGKVKENYTLTSGSYYLGGDVTLNSELTIEDNNTVYICLNDKKLENIATTGCVIYVGKGSKFTLCDCKNSGKGCITGGNGHSIGSAVNGGGIYVYYGATFNMFGGVIKGNNATHGGGGIYSIGESDASPAYVNIYGGRITDNYVTSANSQGGGIRSAHTSLKIFGGSIDENSASRGGGICLDGIEMTISNAAIINNSTNTKYGGGIFLSANKLSISGTVNITGNLGKDTTTVDSTGNEGLEYVTNNVFLRNNYLLNATDSLEGSSIGVTAQSPPTSTKPTPVQVAGGKEYGITPADWSCFFSDKDGYEILWKETTDNSGKSLNELWLALPGNCDLGGLDLSTEGVKLEPDFQENKTTYTATVGNDVESIDITATLKNKPAEGEEKLLTMKIDKGEARPIISGEKQTVNLDEGKNTIAITVTSGGMSKTYTIEIERKAPEGPAEYKVTLNGNDGTGTDLTSYTYGMGAKLPTDWTRAGYTFAGWYEDEGCEGTAVTEISATATGDKEYYAKWTAKTYAVTYNTNGGTIADENNFKKYTYGTGMTLPTPAKTGYTFDGWYEQSDFSGSKVTGISATDTGAKTYYAKWTLSSYTISYNLDDGTAVDNPTTYTVESSTIALKNPTKEGYTFTGWSGTGLTGEQNTTVTIPKGSTGNRTYTAHWTAAGYKVTLEGKGGTGGTSLSTYTHGTKVELPTDWMKNGYTFAGWYEDESCEGTAVTEIPANATGDKKYWAGWTANSYTISYNLDGGTVTGNPTTYTVENNAITLVNPTKEGYTFTGWSGTGLTGEQNTTVTIPKGSTGNRTYTAHWKLADYCYPAD